MSFAEALGRIRDRKSPGTYDHLPSGLCLTLLDSSNTTVRIDAGNKRPRDATDQETRRAALVELGPKQIPTEGNACKTSTERTAKPTTD